MAKIPENAIYETNGSNYAYVSVRDDQGALDHIDHYELDSDNENEGVLRYTEYPTPTHDENGKLIDAHYEVHYRPDGTPDHTVFYNSPRDADHTEYYTEDGTIDRVEHHSHGATFLSPYQIDYYKENGSIDHTDEMDGEYVSATIYYDENDMKDHTDFYNIEAAWNDKEETKVTLEKTEYYYKDEDLNDETERVVTYNEDGSIESDYSDVDKTTTYFNTDGSVRYVEVNDYNNDIFKCDFYDADGKISQTHHYDYPHEDGTETVLSTDYYREDGNVEYTKYYDGKGDTARVDHYDSKGNIERTDYYKNGKLDISFDRQTKGVIEYNDVEKDEDSITKDEDSATEDEKDDIDNMFFPDEYDDLDNDDDPVD